ncbi:MAG: class I SAM-dependent methyltransferase [Gammaproteobacteria bacterium]|nr:class I SAM-dependent methyltransferase [Gammaproteobacteria bacterium]
MLSSAAAPATGSLLEQALAATHRDAANRERDRYRHPKETLEFMGLRPGMTVVEIWPAAGWYTEILAPFVRDAGQYYGAIFVLTAESPEYQHGIQAAFLDKLKGTPALYDRVKLTEMGAGRMDIAPAGSADLVLTFRNVHNWMKGGFVQNAFKAFYTTLKPGGVLGVVEHRARPGTPLQQMIDSGYVTEEQVIAYAREAGFALEEKSEINANAADSTNHPRGVWTLPPGFALCRELKPGPEADACKKPWQEIGESDRMTLRFRKPMN